MVEQEPNLLPQLDQCRGRGQAGFRKNRSTTDRLFIIGKLIEKTRDCIQPLYLLFRDFQNAFDSVYLSVPWTLGCTELTGYSAKNDKYCFKNARK